MAKQGVSIRIDVNKIDKSKLYKGEKGTYLDLTAWIDTDNPSPYGDHGIVTQSISKEERESGVQMPILGNTKVFYGAGNQQPQPASPQAGPDYAAPQGEFPKDEGSVPF